MPYREEMSPDYMLSNIFSTEIPVIHETLIDWLRKQPAAKLARWDVSPDAVSARTFYPRTLLGAYLSAQLQALATAGNNDGHQVEFRTEHDVVDVRPERHLVTIVAKTPKGALKQSFDKVVLTTGHTWQLVPREGEASLVSPWPASNIATLRPTAIGILGSSLSAVDVAVALAHEHGRFTEDADGLIWTARPGSEGLHITMISKTGLLPEADFYYAYPYEPLIHLTEDAVECMIADHQGRMLERTFDLLMREVQGCDPGYIEELKMHAPTIEAFSDGYFSRRRRLGAFRAIQVNLAESKATIRRKETIAWRYALLRGHEIFEAALPHISDDEWDRFRTHLLPVFADCYAAVPHLSLERLAALRVAGAIDVVESGEDAEFLSSDDGGVIVRIGRDEHLFDAMVDARGQTAALPAELPFPSLLDALIDPEKPLEAPFRLALHPGFLEGVFCLSMPQILVRYPFSQGLPNCDTLSAAVAKVIVDAGQ